ncbi:hypothetical protein [Polaribacter sp. Q13]|uniref:hypothetical protein n=1 Tax=Polaribacter sp. Q13 TaxID=2806551 RepID=UPI00193BC831|nr:hypothetical protein [Polaribacter sp. Q13]QVY64615.1 hypothetical protein JOP69_12660 [Polaribacter sp. Q13]
MAILKDKFVETSPKILGIDDLLLSLDMGNREAVLNIVLVSIEKIIKYFFKRF